MNTAKLSDGINQLSLSFAIMLRGAAGHVCANTSLARECDWGEHWWLLSGESKATGVILEYWNTILLLYVLACGLTWQTPVSLGPFLQLIFILNIAQGRLVNAFIPIHRRGLKYEVGSVLLWIFSSHAQHNPLFKSRVLHALFHFFTCSSLTKGQRASGLSRVLKSKEDLVFRKHKDILADSQPPQKPQTAGLSHCWGDTQ